MSTSFNLIYEKFMEMISDSTLALLPDEDLKEILFQYLDRAKSIEFKQCKSDLSDINILTGEFVADLTGEEMWILACGMVIGWLEPKIQEEKLLRETIGSKDIKKTSHANQLDKLMALEELARARLKKYINSYTFNKFEGLS